jgi:hypothetical protein
MEINSIRLGFAYYALKQTLGENFAPISFADFSMAFLERRCGLTFFCSATRDALWIGLAEPSGTLGNGLDDHSRALKAKAEPAYLSLSQGFERDFKNATATEHRAAKNMLTSSATPPSLSSKTPTTSLVRSTQPASGMIATSIALPEAPRVLRAPRKISPPAFAEPLQAPEQSSSQDHHKPTPRFMPTPRNA